MQTTSTLPFMCMTNRSMHVCLLSVTFRKIPKETIFKFFFFLNETIISSFKLTHGPHAIGLKYYMRVFYLNSWNKLITRWPVRRHLIYLNLLPHVPYLRHSVLSPTAPTPQGKVTWQPGSLDQSPDYMLCPGLKLTSKLSLNFIHCPLIATSALELSPEHLNISPLIRLFLSREGLKTKWCIKFTHTQE